MDPLARTTETLRAVYGGRPWLLAWDHLAGTGSLLRDLRDLGATRLHVVAASRGTGDVPGPGLATHHVLGVGAPDLMDALRAGLDALAAVPPAVQAGVDAVDPERAMRTLGTLFHDGRPCAGRPCFGARPAAWQALEDKVTVDALWDAVGIARAPSAVVPLTPGHAEAASRRLDQGHGVVWAGDTRAGFHGGATGTRWVVDADDAARARAHLSARSDRVRVMPFVEGVPCGVGGLVLPDGVVVLRPVEMLVLRRGRDLVYAGTASTWRAPAAVAEAMRGVVERVGTHLADTVGYRGAFTVDGVATPDRFVPTELNPRVGGSMGPLLAPWPIHLVNLALVEGHGLGVSRDALQAALDRHLAGRAHVRALLLTPQPVAATGPFALAWDGAGWRDAEDAHATARIHAGPSPMGGLLIGDLDPAALPTGPSLAPRIAALARWADAALGTSLGPLHACDPGTGIPREG